MNRVEVLDLIDMAGWEDCGRVDVLTLEEAGFEEINPTDNSFASGINAYLEWWHDGEMSEFDK